jgi:hypothetical protein
MLTYLYDVQVGVSLREAPASVVPGSAWVHDLQADVIHEFGNDLT